MPKKSKINKFKHIIGVDEVGMGSLAGPVVVCAIITPSKFKIGDFGVRDSKQLSPKQREACAEKIKKMFSYKISLCYPKTIDRLNIYQASRRAMRRAISRVSPPSPSYSKRGTEGAIVLVDGNKKIPNLNFPQQAIVKGDQKVFAIACASILAKVYRDNMMRAYAKKYPAYAFARHKGYGTRLHYAMLAKHGASAIHRLTFL